MKKFTLIITEKNISSNFWISVIHFLVFEFPARKYHQTPGKTSIAAVSNGKVLSYMLKRLLIRKSGIQDIKTLEHQDFRPSEL